MTHLLLLGSSADRVLLAGLEETFRQAGFAAAALNPDLGREVTLPAPTYRAVEQAQYFIYLLTPNSRRAPWLAALEPAALAALCGAQVQVLLLVCDPAAALDGLAHLPALYFLDGDSAPALWSQLAADLALVHGIEPRETTLLRYSAADVESFLEMAQSLAVAYSGLDAAWEGLAGREAVQARALFHRLVDDLRPELHTLALEQFERRAAHLPEQPPLTARMLAGCRQLTGDWHDVRAIMAFDEPAYARLRSARLHVAGLINLFYLVLTLKLLPYCERYLSQQGLLHTAAAVDTDREPLNRLEFLLSFPRFKNP